VQVDVEVASLVADLEAASVVAATRAVGDLAAGAETMQAVAAEVPVAEQEKKSRFAAKL
jgi:hypothetical protein